MSRIKNLWRYLRENKVAQVHLHGILYLGIPMLAVLIGSHLTIYEGWLNSLGLVLAVVGAVYYGWYARIHFEMLNKLKEERI